MANEYISLLLTLALMLDLFSTTPNQKSILTCKDWRDSETSNFYLNGEYLL